MVGGGAVTAGDIIQYFVVAQDTLANLGSVPSGVSGPIASVTFAGTPNSYNIVAALTGTKTVCAATCDYTTLTAAGGVFASINAGALTGNLSIEVSGDLTAGEDGSVALNAPVEEPAASNFTIEDLSDGCGSRDNKHDGTGRRIYSSQCC